MAAFTPDTLIKDVLVQQAGRRDRLRKARARVPQCLAAGMESVSAVASMHDVPVSALLDELNDLPHDVTEKG